MLPLLYERLPAARESTQQERLPAATVVDIRLAYIVRRAGSPALRAARSRLEAARTD
ncbi:MAG: hypothetical protein ACYC63_19780 [Armatimonadota bacterium]